MLHWMTNRSIAHIPGIQGLALGRSVIALCLITAQNDTPFSGRCDDAFSTLLRMPAMLGRISTQWGPIINDLRFQPLLLFHEWQVAISHSVFSLPGSHSCCFRLQRRSGGLKHSSMGRLLLSSSGFTTRTVTVTVVTLALETRHNTLDPADRNLLKAPGLTSPSRNAILDARHKRDTRLRQQRAHRRTNCGRCSVGPSVAPSVAVPEKYPQLQDPRPDVSNVNMILAGSPDRCEQTDREVRI